MVSNTVYRALVENPYYLEDYDGKYGWSNKLALLFSTSKSKEFVPLEITVSEDGIIVPYYDRHESEEAFHGMTVTSIKY